MMYRVHWKIDVEADSAREAAEQALKIQRDPESIATVFEVTHEVALHCQQIDLGNAPETLSPDRCTRGPFCSKANGHDGDCEDIPF